MDQPGYFAVIPATVRYDKSLPAFARLLYGEITALTQKEGFCYAGNQYFAELYDVDKDTISGWIGKLKKAGYIDVIIDQKNGNSRKIYLKNMSPVVVNSYTTNDRQVYDESPIGIRSKQDSYTTNDRHNNTVNSKENNRRRKSEKSSPPSGEEVKSSNITPKAEIEQVTPTPSSAAPPPDETPEWVKRQQEQQRETMKPSGIKTWEEAVQAIREGTDFEMLVNRQLRAFKLVGWNVEMVVAKFIEQKSFQHKTPQWKNADDVRGNFNAWMPKHFESPANHRPPVTATDMPEVPLTREQRSELNKQKLLAHLEK